MPILTTIDKLAAKRLHERLNAAINESPALKALALEFGLKITPGRAKYDATQITISVEARIEGAVDPMVVQLAAMDGFDATKPGKTGHRLVGYGRGGRMPWKIESADGRPMKAATAWCLREFGPVAAADKPTLTVVDNLISKAG